MTERTDLATVETGPQAIVTKAMGDTVAMLSMIRDLALDPNITAEKLKVVAEVANGQKDRAVREEFYAAKVAALLEMPVIAKGGRIVIADKNGDKAKDRVQGTFAKWPDLQRAIVPILARHDLILTHDIDHEGTIITVTPILQHRNTFVERGGAMQLPLDTSGGKNNTQGAGSAASYGKRHTTIAMLGIRLEDSDDDGGLMATADEPLNDQQERLVKVAEERSANGEYVAWFAKLDPKDRAWFVQTGRDATYRQGAAEPPANASPSPPPSSGSGPSGSSTTAAPSPSSGGGGGGTGPSEEKPDVRTAEGWTKQYELDCAAARTEDDLARIKTKGASALVKLSDKNPKLWERCDAAEVEARDRIKSTAPTHGGLFGGDE
jgi:hypothetical protein